MGAMMGFESPNYTQIPNDLLGTITGDGDTPGLMAEMSEIELKVSLALCRLTFGFHQSTTWASISRLQALTGLSRPAIIQAGNALVEMGLFEKDTSRGVTRWRVVVTQAPDNDSLPNGKQKLPEDSKHKLPPSRKETPKETKETIDANASIPPDDTVHFDTEEAKKLQERLAHNAKAKGHRGPRQFPSLEMKRKFIRAVGVLGDDFDKMLIQALEQGRTSVTSSVNYLAVCAKNRQVECRPRVIKVGQ
jgi:hypothetical protein